MTEKVYINDPGYEVPKDKILVIPFDHVPNIDYEDIVESLKGHVKRDWFNDHFYYCLPLIIGNQYGFAIKSTVDFDVSWNGKTLDPNDLIINIKDQNHQDNITQNFKSGFAEGVLTVQNMFALKTPPGVNIMTIQPPNTFIPGMYVMTGVVETDQLRRDFSFNLKLTDPTRRVSVKKGDILAAFIPVPRYFVDSFEIEPATKYFDKTIIQNEHSDGNELNRQRHSEDLEMPHQSGRKYFKGIHAFGEEYSDHQKRIK